MMLGKPRKLISRSSAMFGVGLVAIGGALYYEHARVAAQETASRNYVLVYSTPVGWRAEPHSPQALFLYRDPRTNLLMRGAMTDIVADFNPTPDMDRDGTARMMLDITNENFKDWNAKLMDVVDAKGVTFRIIRRWNPIKCVVSAVAVRGNTTIVVTLSADKRELGYVDNEMPRFRQYLESLEFRRHIWEN